jgi:hypothetical protein
MNDKKCIMTVMLIILPTSLVSLIGREQEIVKLRQLLHRPDVRLVTITSPGTEASTQTHNPEVLQRIVKQRQR